MACPAEPPRVFRFAGPLIWALPLLVGLPAGGCRTAHRVPRYIATVAPIDVLGSGHPGLCIAVDPADAHSAWWWEPGSSGCATRSTGPALFRVTATVAASSSSGHIDVHFELPLHVGVRDVRMVLLDGRMRDAVSGATVSTTRRGDLDIPYAFGR